MRSRALAVAWSVLVWSTVALADPSVTVAGVVRAGETTRVTANFPGSSGPIRGVAALGSVGSFKETSPGVFEADYVPPPSCGPAQVVIAAFEDRPSGQVASGVAIVSDQASAKVKVHTHEAVYVRVGSIRAGPFHAVAGGEVSLIFAANGNSKEARVETAQGKPLTTFPVKVRVADVALFLRPTRVRPGESAPAEVVMVAPDAARLGAVTATAAAGTLSAPTVVQPGVVRFAFTPPAHAASDIAVKVADASGQPLTSGSFEIAGQRVDQVLMKLPGKPLGAGELAQLALSLRDKEGHPTDGDLTLEADCGTLIPAIQMAPGLYTSSFTAPTTLPAGMVAHLKAHASNSELDAPAQAEFDLPLHGDKPDHVVIAAVPALHPGDKAQIKFQVLDKSGNPADADNLSLAADKGTVSDVHPAPDGSGYLATYTAPEDTAQHITLEVHDGPLRLDGQQQFDVAAPPEAPGPIVFLGPAVGFTSNLGAVNTASIVGEAMFRFPYYLSAGLFAGYLPATGNNLTSTGTGPVAGSASFSRIPIHPRVGGLYLQGPFEIHAGIEVGPTDMSGKLTTADGRSADLSGWQLEYGAYIGGGYQIGPGYLSGELRGTQAKIDVKQDNLVVEGSIGGVDVSIGYLFSI